MYDPLVGEVIRLMQFFDTGNLAVALPSDPPQILIEAIDAYQRAVRSTQAEEERQAIEARKQRR